MVALLARVHLTPVATNAIDQLLRDNPVNTVSQYCKGAGDLMADVSSWADNVRNTDKTGKWHYIDIPLAQKHEDSLAKWCEPVTDAVPGKDRTGCVTTAIEYNTGILNDPARSSADRAQALRFLIHFIGDMHNPLHTVNDQQGGNCTSIQFFAEAKPSNLHSIWDTKMIAKRLADAQLNIAQYATSLDERFAGDFRKLSKGNAADWVWEGHGIAEKVTYGDLSPKIPVQTSEVTDCNAERAKSADLHIAVTDKYYEKAMPAVDEQLARAGYRLAAFLNQNFDEIAHSFRSRAFASLNCGNSFSCALNSGVWTQRRAPRVIHRIMQVQHLVEHHVLQRQPRRARIVEDPADHDHVVAGVEMPQPRARPDVAPAQPGPRHHAAEVLPVQLLETPLPDYGQCPARPRCTLRPRVCRTSLICRRMSLRFRYRR